MTNAARNEGHIEMMMGMEVMIQTWEDWNDAVKEGDYKKMEEVRLSMSKFPKGTFEALNKYGNKRYQKGVQDGKTVAA